MITTSWHFLRGRAFGKLPLLFAVISLTAKANILVNGGFESPSVPTGNGQSFGVGSSGIPGWSIVGPSGTEVEVFNQNFVLSGYTFPAHEGVQFLDLTGNNSNNTEGVAQTVSTVPGRTYTLTFWVGNVSGGSFGVLSSVGLKINGNPVGNFTNSTPGTKLAWQQFSYSFIATATSTTIEFDNLDPDIANALDDVDLEEGGTASPLPTNLLVNGDFETPTVPTGGVVNFATGSTQLSGWSVLGTAASNTVAIVSGETVLNGYYATAQDGHQWLDLTGSDYSSGTRAVSQTVPTTPGSTYNLSFWVGSIYDTRAGSSSAQTFGPTSTVAVKINGTASGTFVNDTQPAANSPDPTVQIWKQFSLSFTATSASTTIEFDNLDPPTDTCNGLDNVVLQQAVAGAPSISAGGVLSATAFGGFTAVSPGSWIEIYGHNLATNTRPWAAGDFSGINAPTSLDGTSVSIGGVSAFIDYISPGQVNALIPSNVTPGTQQIAVTNGQGTSTALSVTVNATQPGLLAPAAFTIGGVSYVVAILGDGSYALPTGAIANLSSKPAKAGDVITLYGIGFGPVTPSTPAGQLVQQLNSLAAPFQLFIGGMQANVSYFGLAPNYTGLYQFNVTVPSLPSGNAAVTFNLGGVQATQTLYLPIN